MLKKLVQGVHMGRVVRDAVLILQGEYKIRVGLRSAELERVQRIVSCHGSLGIRPHDVATSFACEHLAQLSDSDPKKPALASFYSLVAAGHHAAGRVTDANLNGLKNEELRLIGKQLDVSDERKREIEKKALELLERHRRGEDVGIDVTPAHAIQADDSLPWDEILNTASSEQTQQPETSNEASLTPRELKVLRKRQLNPNYRAPLEVGPARDDRDPISIMGERFERAEASSDEAADHDENNEDSEEFGAELVDLVRRIVRDELVTRRTELRFVHHKEILGEDLFTMVTRVTTQEWSNRSSSAPLPGSESNLVTEDDAELFGSPVIDALRFSIQDLLTELTRRK